MHAHPLQLNSNFTSLFRVRYSEHMFKQLLEGIRNREMDVLDRFQIANDLFAIASSGRVPVSQFLEFFTVCGQTEENLSVWESVTGSLVELDQVLGHLGDDDALRGRFHKFVCRVVEPVAAKYGWEPRQGEGGETWG
jgi:puromycin-sensitive aminopeptidase